MDVAARLLADTLDERADERLGRGAGRPTLLEKAVPVEAVDGAGVGDRGRRVGRDDAGRGTRRRQRALPSSIAASQARPETASELLGDVQACERGHTAKNVVCAAPCRWMSKRGRRPPAPRPSSRAAQASAPEDRIGLVRLARVREVEAGHDALQQPAREDTDCDVRCLEAAAGPGTRPGFTVTNSKRPRPASSARTGEPLGEGKPRVGRIA